MAQNQFVSSEQNFLLSRARVPMRRRRLVPRQATQDRLYHKMKQFIASQESRWLLVWGMPGSGKTELVNSLLWDRPELCFAHFGRIIWLKDCRTYAMPSKEWTYFAGESLLMATMDQFGEEEDEDLIEDFLLGEEVGRESWTRLGERLNRELANAMVDTLIILDGVISAETVKFFDEYMPSNCKLLATSTSIQIFSLVEPLITFQLNSDELTEEELCQMAKCHGIQEEFTWEELQKILHETGGNLALLDKLFTLARGDCQIFSTFLAKFAQQNGPLSQFRCYSSYAFHELEQPLEFCFDMIGHYLCSSLEHCTVLERFAWTPMEIILLIWPLDVCGNESPEELASLAMHQLHTVAHNSLLDCREGQNIFRLHPLVHSFLLHSRPKSHATFLQASQVFVAKLRQKAGQVLYADYLATNEKRLVDLANVLRQAGKPRTLMDKNGTGKASWTWNSLVGIGTSSSLTDMLRYLWMPPSYGQT